MDTLYGTPFMRGPRSSPGRRGGVSPDQMRVSDAERAQVADELGKHYADGRLDEAEFNERLAKAMGAKTRGDLAGLLNDLPSSAPPAPPPVPRRRGRRAAGVVLLALLVVAMAAGTWHLHIGLVVLLLVAVLIWRRHHRHLHRWHGGHPGHSHWAAQPPPPSAPPGRQDAGWS